MTEKDTSMKFFQTTAALAAGLLLATAMSNAAHAESAYQRGPAPTIASVEAPAGPYQVGNEAVKAPVGYKAGTVYYPRDAQGQSFGLIVVTPGFIETQSWNAWWARYLASHGFVVINIDTQSTLEFPAARAKEELAALDDVVRLSAQPDSPFHGLVDASRQGAMGHSMGGGASLELAKANPYLKAIVPMAPFQTSGTDYSKLTVPTLVMACKGDVVATASSHSEPIYASLSSSLDKAYLEMQGGGGHPCTTSLGTSDKVRTLAGKYGLAWFKRFLDEDTRYSQFLCGVPHVLDMFGKVISGYKGNCPY
jgi:dienelactone hydrolase